MFNAKVKCTKPASDLVTLGKTYEIKDDYIVLDNGHAYGSYRDFNDFQSSYHSLFELIPDRPRICEVLGVEVGEKFDFIDEGGTMQFKGYYVNENGNIVTIGNNGMSSQTRLEALINGKIKIIRAPQFSEDEKALFRLYVSASHPIFKRYGNHVEAWNVPRTSGAYIPSGLLPQITDEFNAAEYLEGLK